MSKQLLNNANIKNIVNFIIDYSWKLNNPVTNLKLNKILFFLQGYTLEKYHETLFAASFSKYKYGPVQIEIYNELKEPYGSSPIKNQLRDYYFDNLQDIQVNNIKPITKNNFDNSKIFENLKKVTKTLILTKTWKLSELTINHPTYTNFKDDIQIYAAKNYTSNEIQQCYHDCKLNLESQITQSYK